MSGDLVYNPATVRSWGAILAIASTRQVPERSATLTLVLHDGPEEKNVFLERFPFTVGRLPDRDLVLKDARASREHAHFYLEGESVFLSDDGSRWGTFVNGEQLQRPVEIRAGDRIQFGPSVTGIVQSGSTSTQQVIELLSQFSAPESGGNELEKLTLFLETARALSASNVLSDVLAALIDSCITLTGAERGFVFLRQNDGDLRLAAARNSRKQTLTTDESISHSILRDTVQKAGEFIISDTSKLSSIAARQSIVAHDLRSVISIPLRFSLQNTEQDTTPSEIRGVLYLDSQFVSADLSKVDHQILRAIASEAAMLLENAVLMQAEESRKRYAQELAIAASIQQGLMPAKLPDVPFANVKARNISCREIGGDFYDVLYINGKLNLVVADVSGKGVSSALLAAILQGLIYSHLMDERALNDAAHALNQFLCNRELVGQYATLFLARLHPNGRMEWIRCGHVPAVYIPKSAPKISRWMEGCMPVGLFPTGTFEAQATHLKPGDRLVIVSDGITEAKNLSEEEFGETRLEQSCVADSPFTRIMEEVSEFRGTAAQNDDVTLMEITYLG